MKERIAKGEDSDLNDIKNADKSAIDKNLNDEDSDEEDDDKANNEDQEMNAWISEKYTFLFLSNI